MNSELSGYSGTPLAKKLGIAVGSHVVTRSAPTNYAHLLEPIPDGVVFEKMVTQLTDVIHVFCDRKSSLKTELKQLRKSIRSNGVVWISWPKKASKVPTDITEDTIREIALPLGFVDIKVCAVSEVSKRIASGTPQKVLTAVKVFVDAHTADNILIFDAETSLTVEIDLRGSLSAVLKRLPATDSTSPTSLVRMPGRPKLGVTAREITLLPRHWEWLATQPGGASVALRKLVEQARHTSKDADKLRLSQESAYRFMSAMAGNAPGFEEAARALFAADLGRLREFVTKWPRDVRNHTLSLAEATIVKSEALERTP